MAIKEFLEGEYTDRFILKAIDPRTTFRYAQQGFGYARGAIKTGGDIVGWFDSAIALLGDLVDPFLPGFAGSERRATSRKTSLAIINQDRAAAGLAPISGGRRRRKRALTKSDREDIGFIAGMISKAAARDFAMIVAGGR